MAETVAAPLDHAPSRNQPRSDSALVRRVRLRLMLFSGGSTLVILAVLATLLYNAVASSLASDSRTQLEQRAAILVRGTAFSQALPIGPVDAITTIPARLGFVFGGGPTSGTLAFLVPPEGAVSSGGVAYPPIADLAVEVDPAGLSAARGGETVVNQTSIGPNEAPVRVLSMPVDLTDGRYVAQIVADRTAELRTLQVLLVVLLGGGLAALAAALGFGWLYADRALVPIRDALRRQREFAADASHELRTPLTVVRGSVEHLRRHAADPVGSVGTALDDIDAEVVRLTALVDDLLLLARTDSGSIDIERVPTDLADVVLDAAPPLAALAERSGAMLVVDAEPAPLTGDPARLRQLVAILVDNAVRHAPQGSEVRATVGIGAGEVTLRVDDAGPGIRPEHLPHIFDRFWQAPGAPDGGTGLGLSIAAWIVERHRGTIRALDGPGGGARLEVRLPAS